MTEDAQLISFAEKLLSVLDRGSFSATYKYAVLLALMDLCLELTGQDGRPPDSVTTAQLAEKTLELYWPHANLYVAANGAVVLRQGSRQSKIITRIVAFKQKHLRIPTTSLPRARHEAPKQFAHLLESVEWKLAEDPIPRLQTVGAVNEPFIYQIGWTVDLKRSSFREVSFDRNLYLVGAAAKSLVRLSGLIRPLVQREWSSLVARYNRDWLDEAVLEEFLFGQERTPTEVLRGPLAELQHGRCFYCDTPLTVQTEVDHFLPWSRYPNDNLENLVASHRRCNSKKSDHIAAAAHLDKWADRFLPTQLAELQAIGAAASWITRPERTLGAARAIYMGLPDDAVLWQRDGDFLAVEPQRAAITHALRSR